MNFRTRRRDHPELNLIPMIDVLIVLLIFLVLTTTFRHESALKIKLPESGGKGAVAEKGIEVSIDAASRISVGQALLPDNSVVSLRNAIAAVSGGRRDTMIVIRADRNTPHQAVMTVLDVAAGLGFTRITFATHEAGTRP